jgi:uncharacterized protein (DUF342 family)
VISVDDDALSCAITLNPSPGAPIPSPEELTTLLEGEGIGARSIDHGAVAELIDRITRQPGHPQTLVVARGKPPVHGSHASFTLCPTLRARLDAIEEHTARIREAPRGQPPPDPAAGAPGIDRGAIDHRACSAFIILKRGDRIGAVSEASDGEDGLDVRGRTIPARRGHTLSVHTDESVEIREGAVFAAIPGVLRVSIDRLIVEPVLAIDGDVSYQTGHIDFPGEVVVSGGVKDCFIVRAGGRVAIDGLVEAAMIHGAGDVVLKQGMAGRDQGTVEIRGDLDAGYLDGVRGEVEGHCRVAREVKACRLRIGRTLEAPKGVVHGGRIEARQSVDVAVIGGSGGVQTEIAVGGVDELADLVRRLADLRTAIVNQRDRAEHELAELQKRIARLSPTQAERMTELQFRQIRSGEFQNRLMCASHQLLNAALHWSSPTVTARKAIHKGALIMMRTTRLLIRDTVQGPVLFDLDQAGEPRCFLRGDSTPTPIAKVARVEQASADEDPIRRLREMFGKAA